MTNSQLTKSPLPRWLALIVVVSLLIVGGCYTRTIVVPGVLDLRSDASGLDDIPHEPSHERSAQSSTESSPNARTGLSSMISGAGLTSQAGHVVIEERTAWALGFFVVHNASATEELTAALDVGGALTEFVVEERVNATDVALYFTKLVPVINLVGLWATPTFTAYFYARQAQLPTAGEK